MGTQDSSHQTVSCHCMNKAWNSIKLAQRKIERLIEIFVATQPWSFNVPDSGVCKTRAITTNIQLMMLRRQHFLLLKHRRLLAVGFTEHSTARRMPPNPTYRLTHVKTTKEIPLPGVDIQKFYQHSMTNKKTMKVIVFKKSNKGQNINQNHIYELPLSFFVVCININIYIYLYIHNIEI